MLWQSSLSYFLLFAVLLSLHVVTFLKFFTLVSQVFLNLCGHRDFARVWVQIQPSETSKAQGMPKECREVSRNWLRIELSRLAGPNTDRATFCCFICSSQKSESCYTSCRIILGVGLSTVCINLPSCITSNNWTRLHVTSAILAQT